MLVWFFSRVLISALLIGVACLIAGVFGMAHNQISVSVAPTYFFDLKFDQFRIPISDHNAWGAALVGWQASWWMGGFLGVFLVGLGFRILSHRIFAGAFIKISIFVVIFSILVAGAALFAAQWFISSKQQIPSILNTYGSTDLLGFFHAAVMHEASYYASVLGLGIGYFVIFRPALKRDRKIRGNFD